MFTKSKIISFSVGVFFSGALAIIVSQINALSNLGNFSGGLIVVIGFASLIFGLTRKS